MKKAFTSKSEDKFADFFLHATEEQKNAVFLEAARKAAADQRKIMKKAGVEIPSSS